jgi:cyclophilin family peptidyl-prolyl cis-trans isomerase
MKVLRLLFLLSLAIGLVIATGCGGSPPPEDAAPPEKTAEPAAEAPAEPPPAEPVEKEEAAPPAEKKAAPQAKSAPAGNPVVVVETSKGTIKIELDADKAPETVANFLRYVDDKFYDGTIFHRVIPRFMIQGGGMTPNMSEKPTGDPIKNESANGLANNRGTIAMARLPDPHSATSQFFINHVTNVGLNRGERDEWGYCVFGKVTEGMDVVDAIAQVPTGNRDGHSNVPVEPVMIKSIRRASASAS